MNRQLLRVAAAYDRFRGHERVFSLAVAVAIGVVAGFGDVVVQLSIHYATLFFGLLPQLAERVLHVRGVGVVLAPALGGLIIGPIIFRFAREAKGHGVPEVMAAVIRRGGFIRPRVAFVKAFASAVCIGSGGSVGREGPIIQVGSSIGSTIGYLLHMPPRMMRTFVACGAAGGIAATFNAPIAGPLFAVEIILGDFGFIQLAPIVTSSVIATVISRRFLGDETAFHVPSYALHNPAELITYVGLGIACGVCAVLFIRTLDRAERIFEHRIRFPEPLKPALGGLVVGGIGLFLPQVFGMGYATMDQALFGKLQGMLLVLLVFAKMLATSVTLSSGGSGGVFAPSLFMGAMTGGAVGEAAKVLFPVATASSGAYALVGMGAMVGAATHAPITAIVMIFEMTNDYAIILPLMISTIVAVLLSNHLNNESIYTHKLKRMGIDVGSGIESNVLRGLTVRSIMRPDYDHVPHDLPFNFLLDTLLQSSRSRIAVVDDEQRLVGVISRELAQKFLSDRNLLTDMIIARDVATQDTSALVPEDSLETALLRFTEFNCRELYVIASRNDPHIVGMVRKGDLLDAYQREMVKQEAGATFAYNINRPRRMETVQVMDGYAIIEVEAPHRFSGKAIRELDLRNRFGINILAIKRLSGNGDRRATRMWVPESADLILDGDVLVVLGESQVVQTLRERF